MVSLANLERKNKKQVENSDFVELDDGSVVIELPEEEVDAELPEIYKEGSHYENLVDKVDEDTLQWLSDQVLEGYRQDEQSRQGWLETLEKGLELLGIEVKEKNTPFKNACSAQHPLLLEACVKFQSKASNELLPADGPVNTKILGDLTIEKEDQALRVKKHMNWQVTEEMTEFIPDSEKLLLLVPAVGSSFKKSYFDAHLERPVSELVPAEQFVVNNGVSDLYRAQRYTHVIFKTKDKLNEDFASEFYCKPKCLGDPSQFKRTEFQRKASQLQGLDIEDTSNDEGYTLLEQYVTICIDGLDTDINPKELALPYIVTVDEGSGKVLGIRRNWRPGDSKKRKKVIFSHFEFVPGFGFYGLGYIHLLGNLQMSLTASLRSLVDSGQFANLQGGFKLKGVRIVDDDTPISPGEFKEIESHVQDINKALFPLPFKEPSQTLFAMLQFLDQKGQKFADSTEQVIADAANYGPVGTTMALLDASTKFFSAIHKRLHRAQKNELRIISEINFETLPDVYDYNLYNETSSITRQDYDPGIVAIVPVSDPNISSNAHRMAKAQTMFQIAQQTPEQHDMREVLKHLYTNMDYSNIDKVLPRPEEAQPNDPMTDIQFAVQGKPIKAFIEQDHASHVKIKTAFIMDPNSGSSPALGKARSILEANIQEHLVMQFIQQTTAQAENTGVTIEQAAQEIVKMNQEKLAQEQQGGSNNPEMIKAEASKILAQSEIMDAQIEMDKLKFDKEYKQADLQYKAAQLNLDAVKEVNKMAMANMKIDADMDKLIVTKSLDAQIAGLDNA